MPVLAVTVYANSSVEYRLAFKEEEYAQDMITDN